jgi:O-antigen/teichoic acid export membrane protein
MSLVGLALLSERTELLLPPLIVGYLVAAGRGWPLPGDKASSQVRRRLVRHAAWGTVFVLSSAGLLQLTMVIAGGRSEAEEVGLYAAALALATPGALLAVAVRTALVPELSELHAAGHERELSRRVDRLMRGTVLIALPPFAVASLLAGPLLGLVFGPDYLSADRFLVPLLLGTALSAVTAHQAWLMNGPAWGVRVLAVSGIAALSVGVVITVAGAGTHGMAAASAGFLAGSLLLTLVPYVVVWVRSNQHWGWLTMRSVAGYAAWLTLVQVTQSDPARVAAAASFVVGWCVLNLGDIMMLRRSLDR